MEAQQSYQPQYDPAWDQTSNDDYINELFAENPGEAVRTMLQQELAAMAQQNYTAQQQYQAQQAPMLEADRSTKAQVVADITSRHMDEKYGDWSEHAGRAQEILQERNIPDHELFDIPQFERHVDEAYKLAKYEALTGQENELRSQGVSQEEIDRLRKAQAETLTARRSAPREEIPPEQQKAQELLAARQAAGRPAWYDR